MQPYPAGTAYLCSLSLLSLGGILPPILLEGWQIVKEFGSWSFPAFMTFYHHQAYCTCSVQVLLCSDLPRELFYFINEYQMYAQFWAGEMFHWVKAFAAKSVSPWDSHGGKREPVPSSCALASEFMLWYVCLPPTHTNK